MNTVSVTTKYVNMSAPVVVHQALFVRSASRFERLSALTEHARN
jgi:hypothetical protein